MENLNDYLKEDNPICLKCQWLDHLTNKCLIKDKDIKDLDHTKCDDEFNEYKQLESRSNEKGLFDEC